jgi:protein tyrosine/serine phosphatase
VGGLVALGLEVLHVTVGANFHAVVPGQVYRSAQPSPRSLEKKVRTYGIRTLVNLRGWCGSDKWYVEECRTAKRLRLAMEDIGLWAGQPPSVEELHHLVRVLDQAEYPILLHCNSGGDRAGFASVVFLLLHTDTTLACARRQLGFRYGHNPYAGAACLERFFDQYARWLDKQGREHTPAHFRHWMQCVYRPDDCQ